MNAKKYVFFFTLFLNFGSFGIAEAAEQGTRRAGSAKDMGVGLTVGQPIGVTGKYWLSSTQAVDAFMGFHFNQNMDAHADYLWHFPSYIYVPSGRLPFYVGGGARILLGDSSQLALRFPIGLTYLFPHEPLETFVELAPVMRIVKGIGGDLDGHVGVRYYFRVTK